MKQTTQELKYIRDNSPTETTHVDYEGGYWKCNGLSTLHWFGAGTGWKEAGWYVEREEFRSLSDIKEIIELREKIEELTND